ncbi:AdoMet-dependent rRNA methyltransferase spb1 [Kickxella alabastrina]|nr:AdoMet-dependent rRNA methyltransferase spb1 [Kickxella alabastrina]
MSGTRALKDLREADVGDIDVDIDLADDELVELGSRPIDSDNSYSDADSGDEAGGNNVDSDDEQRLQEMEGEMDEMYSEYVSHKRERDAQFDIKRKRAAQEEFRGFSDEENAETKGSGNDSSDSEAHVGSDSDDDQDMSDDEAIRGMMRDAKKAKKDKHAAGANKGSAPIGDVKLGGRAAMWFDQPIFKGMGNIDLNDITDDEDADEDATHKNISSKLGKRKRQADSIAADVDDASDESDFDIASADEDGDPNDVELKDEERQADYDLANPEAMTMIRDLANRKTNKHDLIDKHFNRYTFNDTRELPDWFVDDEQQHNKPLLPVSKEAVRMLREKIKALDARPIKKVAEAKARKKMRASKRIVGMQRKAEGVLTNDDMTEAEKARSIDRMIKRATKSKPKEKVTVIVARNANRGLKGRPKGIKGKYKMVDPRMKKELRAKRAREKRNKKGGGRR